MPQIDDKRAVIRDLNDRFRRGDSTVPGTVLITLGIQQLIARHPGYENGDVMGEVARFETFDEDNDPYHQHDFGAFDFLGERLFWKIDYYDTDMVYGSPDPADTRVTRRVLTVMLASEY